MALPLDPPSCLARDATDQEHLGNGSRTRRHVAGAERLGPNRLGRARRPPSSSDRKSSASWLRRPVQTSPHQLRPNHAHSALVRRHACPAQLPPRQPASGPRPRAPPPPHVQQRVAQAIRRSRRQRIQPRTCPHPGARCRERRYVPACPKRIRLLTTSLRFLVQAHLVVCLPSPLSPPSAGPTSDHHSVALPCLLVAGVNGKMRWDAHWEHKAHEPPMEEKPEYAYQNIRTKNFFWGDGDKVSLFPVTGPASKR